MLQNIVAYSALLQSLFAQTHHIPPIEVARLTVEIKKISPDNFSLPSAVAIKL